MKLPDFFRWSKRDTSRAARQLRMAGVQRDKALIRAKVDRMNADMGRPPVVWPS